MNNSKLLCTVFLGAGLLVGQGNVFAQEVSASDNRIDEILVTAQKRSQSLQDVPITISAFSGETLDVMQMDTTLELQYIVPGLVFTNNVGFGAPFLRGVGTESGHIGSDASTAVMVDGVYYGRGGATLQDFLDVDHVEVLKGPQGTLYGRNAAGGVVHIVSRRPTDEFYAKTDLSIGDYAYTKIRGAMGGALVDGRVNAQLSFIKADRDGFAYNEFLNKDYDDKNLFGARLALDFLLTDRTNVLVRADYSKKNDSAGMAYTQFDPNSGHILAGGTMGSALRNVYNDKLQTNPLQHWGLSIEIDHQADAFAFKSLTSFRDYDSYMFLDIDNTELERFHLSIDQQTETLTQEFQLTSNDDAPLEWVVGAFYMADTGTTDRELWLLTAGIDGRPSTFDLENTAYAVFAQATKRVFDDRLGLTLGYRFSSEDKTAVIDVNGTVTVANSQKVSKGTPKFAIDYQLSDDHLIYASYTEGFKSSSINEGNASVTPPEFVTAIEVGYKFTLADGRLSGTAAAFAYDYQDLQVQILNPSTGITETTSNDADITGAELEFVYHANDSIQINAGVGYLDNHFSSDIMMLSPLETTARSGDTFTLPRSPELSYNLGLSADFLLGRWGEGTLRVDYSHMDEFFFEQFNQPLAMRSDVDLVNASFTVDVDENWTTSVWLRNLTDEVYVDQRGARSASNGNLGVLGDPRTYGVTLGFTY